MKNKIKSIIKNIVFSIVPPDRNNISFSQAGEDRIISFLLLEQLQIKNMSYLDIGTSDPIQGNNTYFFYKKGISGVCIEADETLIPSISQVRPRDVILNIGIGIDERTDVDFYMFDIRGLNTFVKEEAELRARNSKNKIVKISKVPLLKINTIIQENFSEYPTFLSLDIEGLDLAVLKTLDFQRFPIPVICVETCSYSETHIKPKDITIKDFMTSVGYFSYADTYLNTIFVNTGWFNSLV